MKEITLRVNDEMAQLVEQLVEHLEGVELVASGECDDSIEFCDQCLLAALTTLRENKVIVHPYDFHMNSSPTKLGQNRPKRTLNKIA